MIRTIIWFIYFGISLVFTLPALFIARIYYKKVNIEKVKEISFKKARSWSRQLIWIAGGEIEVIGMENLPKDEPFLVVSNHQSNFDIPILLGYLNIPLAFIAKIETKKMPIINHWMKYLNCIFMDRSDFRQSVKAINDGAKNLKNGYNYAIFPEGTRSDNGELIDFKPGSIKMAMKSKVKIIPVTINGSINMMKKGEIRIKPAKVKVYIHEPIDSVGNSSELIGKVKNIIQKNL